MPASGSCASTSCASPSPTVWPATASRYAIQKSATPTPRPPRSTPTTPPAPTRARRSTTPSRLSARRAGPPSARNCRASRRVGGSAGGVEADRQCLERGLGVFDPRERLEDFALVKLLTAGLPAPARNLALDVSSERLGDRALTERASVRRPRLRPTSRRRRAPVLSATPDSPVPSTRWPVAFHACPYLCVAQVRSTPPPSLRLMGTPSDARQAHLRRRATGSLCRRRVKTGPPAPVEKWATLR
jgi:hypothetical protein